MLKLVCLVHFQKIYIYIHTYIHTKSYKCANGGPMFSSLRFLDLAAAGSCRIRSRTQGIALSLGDRITIVQRGVQVSKEWVLPSRIWLVFQRPGRWMDQSWKRLTKIQSQIYGIRKRSCRTWIWPILGSILDLGSAPPRHSDVLPFGWY